VHILPEGVDYERRKRCHTRLDEETFQAVVDRSVEHALEEVQKRFLIMIAKAVIDKLMSLVLIVVGLAYLYFKK
jgi:hypothetical protein